jgi:UDP-N-acetylglucosamine diphosphorylase/glucosamine-1-phosphate N-acetyltransferase
MALVLFEDAHWSEFLPLVFTKPVGELRIGILTIREKWEKHLQTEAHHETRSYLEELYPPNKDSEVLRVNARVLPDAQLVSAVAALKSGECIMQGELVLAHRGGCDVVVNYENTVMVLEKITDLFSKNHEAIERDFALITEGRTSAPLGEANHIIGSASLIFLEPGAKVNGSFLNTTDGPIYLAADAEILEGSMVRGPLALGEHAQIKMGTKVYTGCTIGPHCKVGGEISNSVFQGYSNKGHDGFLGNSLLGEWCNLGADTNTSNLKNNYSKVRIWNYATRSMSDTGLTFCGLIMGDHSKCGINTMFNTGTVVGVSANIFGGGFPTKHIPSFGWGGSDGFTTYDPDKALETAELVMARRNISLSPAMRKMLTYVFELTHLDREDKTHRQ